MGKEGKPKKPRSFRDSFKDVTQHLSPEDTKKIVRLDPNYTKADTKKAQAAARARKKYS